MDTLKNKSFMNYDSISRYSKFPYYYHTKDGKYIYGKTAQLSASTEYIAHRLTVRDTLDSLALKYYGRPDYYWIIADFNRISDPFITLTDYFTSLKIPTLSTIKFEE